MISEKNKKTITERVALTIELFFENEGKISYDDLAQLVTLSGFETSPSTVEQDLISSIAEHLVGRTNYNKIVDLMASSNQPNAIHQR